MKIIKRLAVLLIGILVIIIYITNKDNKIYYISIGDGLSRGINENNKIGYGYSDYVVEYLKNKDKLEFYTKDFADIEKRTTDMINDINNNIEIKKNNKKIRIKKALVHADLITLSIGFNELIYKLTNTQSQDYVLYEYIDELTEDIEELIDIIKKYTKEDIFVLGFYNPFTNISNLNSEKINNLIIYANNELIDICEEEDVTYIDTYNLLSNNNQVFTNINSYYPNIDGHKLISNKIIEKIEQNIIKNAKIA